MFTKQLAENITDPVGQRYAKHLLYMCRTSCQINWINVPKFHKN